MVANRNAPLYASQEKIERAESKFGNLVTLVNGYLAANPYRTRVKMDGYRAYVIGRLQEPLPTSIAFEFSEAALQLRSALDKMVVDLAIKNGRSGSGVRFPFGGLGEDGKPDAFPDERSTKKTKNKLAPDHWAFVLACKPYPGGDDLLWSVNQIANAEKHWEGLVEVFHDAFSHITLTGYGTWASIGKTLPEHQGIASEEEGEEVIFSTSTGHLCGQVQYQITPLVVIGKVPPVERKNVLTTLNEQIQLVKKIVALCRAKFFE